MSRLRNEQCRFRLSGAARGLSFLQNVQPGPGGPPSRLVSRELILLPPGVKRRRVNLSTQLVLMPRLGMCEAVPFLPQSLLGADTATLPFVVTEKFKHIQRVWKVTGSCYLSPC